MFGVVALSNAMRKAQYIITPNKKEYFITIRCDSVWLILSQM